MKSLHKTVSISNALTGESYSLLPLDQLRRSPELISNIVKICNEPLVYRWCFRDLCNGAVYPESMAFEWLDWAARGWKNRSHFVYAVVNTDNSIAAACDIKSANRDRAEIGYWSSASHRGVMTNTLQAVTNLTDQASFKTLVAEIHPENLRSLAVVDRCGFERTNRKPTVKGHISHERTTRASRVSLTELLGTHQFRPQVL